MKMLKSDEKSSCGSRASLRTFIPNRTDKNVQFSLQRRVDSVQNCERERKKTPTNQQNESTREVQHENINSFTEHFVKNCSIYFNVIANSESLEKGARLVY